MMIMRAVVTVVVTVVLTMVTIKMIMKSVDPMKMVEGASTSQPFHPGFLEEVLMREAAKVVVKTLVLIPTMFSEDLEDLRVQVLLPHRHQVRQIFFRRQQPWPQVRLCR